MNHWRRKIGLILILTASIVYCVNSQFFQIPAPFINVYLGSADWADFNQDGYQDLAIAGIDSLNIRKTIVYKNNGDSTFTALPGSFTGVDRADVKWCDYNNDGFADLMILGDTDAGEPVTKLYSNDGDGTFTEIPAGFTGVKKGDAAWHDYNRDGLTDVVVTGEDVNTYTTILYKNNGDSTFTPNSMIFPGLLHSTADWGDYNRDGFPDLLLGGFNTSSSDPVTLIFSNNGNGSFSQVPAGIMGVAYGTARWGDFNNDGYADVFISGSYSGLKAHIYRNNGDSTFTQQSVPELEGLFHCDASVMDFDNDGSVDILLTGHHGPKLFIYWNDGNFTFTKDAVDITPVGYASVAAGDFNNDSKYDVVVSGEISAGGIRRTRLYTLDTLPPNTPPLPPENLSSSLSCGRIILKWTKGNDDRTPPALLSSAVYIGTGTGKSDIINPGSLTDTGFRLSPEPGNAGTDTFMILKGLKPGTYYWGVQHIDLAGVGSAFSEENNFVIPAIPVADAGPDHTICTGLPCEIIAAELTYTPTGNYFWTSSGSGRFDDPALPAPVYTPSEDDLWNGSVKLEFHVSDSYYCPEGVSDDKIFTFTASSILISSASPDQIELCEGEDTLIWVTAEGSGLGYRWFQSEDGTAWAEMEGATDSVLTFNDIALTNNYYYSCLITDSYGCTDSGSVTSQLIVHSYPEKPLIAEANDTLISVASFGYYRWEDELGFQLGDLRMLVPASIGGYRLWVSDNTYCWSASDLYEWLPSGLMVNHAETIMIYPNPASDKMVIKGFPDAGNSISVNLYDMNGAKISSIPVHSSWIEIPVSDLKRGMVIVEIKENDKILSHHILMLE